MMAEHTLAEIATTSVVERLRAAFAPELPVVGLGCGEVVS